MSISVLETYMQKNLDFGDGGGGGTRSDLHLKSALGATQFNRYDIRNTAIENLWLKYWIIGARIANPR